MKRSTTWDRQESLDDRGNHPKRQLCPPLTCTAGLLLILASAGCTTGTEADPLTESADLVVLGTVPEGFASVGDTLELRAAIRTPMLTELPPHAIRWQSSDPTVISVDSLGRAISLGVGVAVVSAFYQGETATAKLASTPELHDLAVALPAGPVFVGSVVEMTARGVDARGQPIPDIPVEWTSRNPQVASITADGVLEGISPGTAELVVRADSISSAVTLNIHESWVGGIEITSSADAVEEGLRASLSAVVRNRSGAIIPETPVRWHLSDVTRASVTGNELLGLRSGRVVLVGSAGDKADSLEITVMPTTVTSVQVTPAEMQVGAGSIAGLQTTVRDATGRAVDDRTLLWTTSDSTVATAAEGVVRAHSPGTVTITAAVGDKAGSATITVPEPSEDDVPDAPARSAFPGAQGWGAEALTSCSRVGMEVLRVTSLADGGAGSLRAAVAAARNDVLSIVVFDVAGRISLGEPIEFRDKQCVYVAGQTAPGGGITISAPGSGFITKGNARDIAIRYLRFRGGFRGDHRGQVNVYIGSGTDIILDHLSTSWTTDKLIVIYKSLVSWSRPIRRVTVQNTILSEAFAAHPTAMQISGQDNDGATAWRDLQDISIHRNLFAHNSHRNPMVTTYGTALSNNVIYNFKQGAIQSTRESRLDAVNNYVKRGPMTADLYDWEVTWVCSANGGYTPSLHVSGNIGPHNSNGNGDQFGGTGRVAACYYNTGSEPGQALPASYGRSSRLPAPPVPVDLLGAGQAYTDVLSDAGASARLACDGGWVDNRDGVDRRVVRDVRDGTGPGGPIAHEGEVGGFPSIPSGTRCPDADGDGMPDAFESRNGLNPSNPDDAYLDRDGDGYTNVEEYVNGMRTP